MCGDGRCLAKAAVPEDARDLLAPCVNADELCVPGPFIAAAGSFLVEECRSVGDTEGRCLSLCIPQVADQADFLPQTTCADTERCAPCYDPRTGEDTGACNQGCDTGPTEP
jgi:hypothetical protein